MLNHRYIPVLLLIFIIHLKLEAWGKTGHRIVGAIAELHLSGQAQDISYDLLNGQSLAHVANWADEIRGDPAWSHSYGIMSILHRQAPMPKAPRIQKGMSFAR